MKTKFTTFHNEKGDYTIVYDNNGDNEVIVGFVKSRNVADNAVQALNIVLFKEREKANQLSLTPTPEKLGVMFDVWSVDVTPFIESAITRFQAIDRQTFIRLATEITSQTRQPETEINLPTTEAVKEWFCEGDNSSSFWNSGSWKNGQVCTEIIDALKYFIVTWQPVRNSKQTQPETLEDKFWSDLSDKFYESKIAHDYKDGKCDFRAIRSWFLSQRNSMKQPEIDCAEMSFNEHFEKKQTEIPEERLREEFYNFFDWYYSGGGEHNAKLVDQYLNERKESKK